MLQLFFLATFSSRLAGNLNSR